MMEYSKVITTISKQLGAIAKGITEDYDIVICPERIFVDDYLPSIEQYYERNSELPSLDVETPEEIPYANTIFVVIKIGSGQRNMAVSETTITLQVMTEENDFEVTKKILDMFLAEYNFEYRDGIIQSYFNPEMVSSTDSVYSGFRAMYDCRGTLRIPEDNLMFVQDIMVGIPDEKGVTEMHKIPFISQSYDNQASTDPQPLSGYNGVTLNLNRQTTQTVSLNTYLFYFSDVGNDKEKAWVNRFAESILRSQRNMNRKFKIAIRTNINGESAEDEGGKVCLANDWFTLVGTTYNQDWGDISTWALTFSRSKEREEGE